MTRREQGWVIFALLLVAAVIMIDLRVASLERECVRVQDNAVVVP